MASPSQVSETKTTDLLECPICMNFMYPPIYQCAKGHILCSKCKIGLKNTECPSCREPLGDIRCLILEKVAETLEFPCIYKESGCSELLKFDAKQKHEEESCRHRPYKCPFPCSPPCPRTGDIQTLVTHMKQDHQCEVKDGDKINTDFRSRCRCRRPNVTICRSLDEYFCLNVVLLDPPMDLIYMYVTFLGDDKDAKKFQYEIELGGHDKRRHITWRANPTSIRKEAQHILRCYDGITIHQDIMRDSELSSLSRRLLYHHCKFSGKGSHEMRVRVSLSKYGT